MKKSNKKTIILFAVCIAVLIGLFSAYGFRHEIENHFADNYGECLENNLDACTAYLSETYIQSETTLKEMTASEISQITARRQNATKKSNELTEKKLTLISKYNETK